MSSDNVVDNDVRPSREALLHGTLRTARPRATLRQGRSDWYRITNLGTSAAEVAIYGEIGWYGITAEDFMAELRNLDASEISLRLNSPGGEIFDGIAIHNLLRSHRARVTTHVDSLAASIASVIALAGDRVIMQPHSQMMIHDGSGLVVGDARDMREMADLLDKQSDNIAGIYAEKAGGTVADWRERMLAETWYTAEEAVAAGLADEVAPGRQRQDEPDQGDPMANSWDLSVFRYAGRAAAPAPTASAETPAATETAAVREGEPHPNAPSPPAADAPADDQGAPAEDAAAETEQPAEDDEPDDETAPGAEPADEPDDWAAMTAHLTNPASPKEDDVFASLREALL